MRSKPPCLQRKTKQPSRACPVESRIALRLSSQPGLTPLACKNENGQPSQSEGRGSPSHGFHETPPVDGVLEDVLLRSPDSSHDYKLLIVDGSGERYLQTVCDYVHLNPVRAKVLRPQEAAMSQLKARLAVKG